MPAMARPIRTSVLPMCSIPSCTQHKGHKGHKGLDSKRISSVSLVSSVLNKFSSQLETREEVPDFIRCGVRCIGSMRRVPFDRLGELLAQRTRVGLCGIGGPHQGPPLLDRVGRFEDQYNRGSGGHELGQAAEERALAVDGVESLRLSVREADALHGTDLESLALDALKDLARKTPLDGVRFDDGRRAFGHIRRL